MLSDSYSTLTQRVASFGGSLYPEQTSGVAQPELRRPLTRLRRITPEQAQDIRLSEVSTTFFMGRGYSTTLTECLKVWAIVSAAGTRPLFPIARAGEQGQVICVTV